MASQAELDKAYISMAETWSRLSKAIRKKVGCIIVKDGSIISDGFNGTPRGFPNSCENKLPTPKIIIDDDGNYVEGTYELVTKSEVLHAESNAITKLAKSTCSSAGATMYITISPCLDCAKLIIQAGIKRVVYGALYRSTDGINLLSEAGIDVLEYNTNIKNY